MFQEYFVEIAVTVLGLCVGSFLNVCIYRFPLSQSIIFPSSFCPECKSNIKWFQNIPVISYIFLWGRCSNCKAKISIQYPFVELLTAFLFLLNYIFFALSFKFLISIIFLSMLIIVVFVDFKHLIIPDEVTIGGVVVGFLLSFLNSDVTWVESIGGIILGGGILLLIIKLFYLLTKKEGMGGGDVKLLAMIGAFLGYKSIFFVVFVSSLLGVLIGVPLLFFKKGESGGVIPFGPFLSFAAIIYFYSGEKIINWYLNFLKY